MSPRANTRFAASFLLALAGSALFGCSAVTPSPKGDEATAKATAPVAAVQAVPVHEEAAPAGDVLLLGPSALYYMYKSDAKASDHVAHGSKREPYRLSRFGRVYYRDSSFRMHWVTPPRDGIRVPAAQAVECRDLAGYQGNAEGRDLVGLAND